MSTRHDVRHHTSEQRSVRIDGGVLVARVVASVAIFAVALAVTAFVDWRHGENMRDAAIERRCPAGVYTRAHSAPASGIDGAGCQYVVADGSFVGVRLTPDAIGEPNIFEPRLSFVVSAVVILSVWFGAVALVRLVWLEGRVIRRPRSVPVIPAPD